MAKTQSHSSINENILNAKQIGQKIGVFVCHCGSNIDGVVDCKTLAENSLKNPGVVYATDYKFLCSDPGQLLIKEKIEELGLDRVVVAACSPRMHEKTFRRVCRSANLNPFLFEQANIREQCTWVHMSEKEKAYKKAEDIIAISCARARELDALDIITVPITNNALIVGAGIGGISAALDLADMGIPVTLVESTPSIGGNMARLDKTFPTMDCSACILTPKMTEVGQHPNINLLTYSEILEVSGYIGNFNVKIKKKPRYVIEDKCNGCGDCVPVCPAITSNPFELHMSPMKAFYIPFPQAVPQLFTINMDVCIKCGNCVKACEPEAIDLNQDEKIIEDEFGAIILSTGI